MSEQKKGTAASAEPIADPVDARRHVAEVFDGKAAGLIPRTKLDLSDEEIAALKSPGALQIIPAGPPLSVTFEPHAVFQMRDALAKRIQEKIPGAMLTALTAAAEDLMSAGMANLLVLAAQVDGREPDDFDPPRRRVEGTCSATECRAVCEHEHGKDCSPACICWRA